MGHDICSFCFGVLNNGHGIESVNRVNIILLPKVPNPTSMTNFRPISLCIVLYKILA